MREVRVTQHFDGFDRTAAAGAVNQTHDGQAKFVRHLLGHDLLLHDCGVAGATAHGEIVTAHDDRAVIDFATAEDEIRRLKIQ
jgi:hypothetical protein